MILRSPSLMTHLHRSLKLSPIEEGERARHNQGHQGCQILVLRASVRETSGQDKGQLLHYHHHSGSGKSCQGALVKGSYEFKRQSSSKLGPCPLERLPPQILSSHGEKPALDWISPP
jgi:hypothetical protein